ncbi:hypothetical protein HOG98_01520 [bacterium]|jgi:hypothetical protein|nr:hypothetical protein [bacterium]
MIKLNHILFKIISLSSSIKIPEILNPTKKPITTVDLMLRNGQTDVLTYSLLFLSPSEIYTFIQASPATYTIGTQRGCAPIYGLHVKDIPITSSLNTWINENPIAFVGKSSLSKISLALLSSKNIPSKDIYSNLWFIQKYDKLPKTIVNRKLAISLCTDNSASLFSTVPAKIPFFQNPSNISEIHSSCPNEINQKTLFCILFKDNSVKFWEYDNNSSYQRLNSSENIIKKIESTKKSILIKWENNDEFIYEASKKPKQIQLCPDTKSIVSFHTTRDEYGILLNDGTLSIIREKNKTLINTSPRLQNGLRVKQMISNFNDFCIQLDDDSILKGNNGIYSTITMPAPVITLASTNFSFCTLLENGETLTLNNISPPTQIPFIPNNQWFVSILSTDTIYCGLYSDGTLLSWDSNPDLPSILKTPPIPSGEYIRTLHSTNNAFCAFLSNGDALIWNDEFSEAEPSENEYKTENNCNYFLIDAKKNKPQIISIHALDFYFLMKLDNKTTVSFSTKNNTSSVTPDPEKTDRSYW